MGAAGVSRPRGAHSDGPGRGGQREAGACGPALRRPEPRFRAPLGACRVRPRTVGLRGGPAPRAALLCGCRHRPPRRPPLLGCRNKRAAARPAPRVSLGNSPVNPPPPARAHTPTHESQSRWLKTPSSSEQRGRWLWGAPSRKGLSQSALPYRRSVPTWLKLTSDDVKEQIYKLAKKGLTPSQIGVILRDSHGVAQVRFVTGNKILRILKSKGLAPDLPEDLYHLIKKAVAVRKHLERNRKDKDAKFRLILIESRIHRLARYYKTKRVLPPNWKYESSTASALVA
ncbi:hypothetical protein KIL84_007820 [Mauremys mutica]|uniref:Small ribosomal subunit protein uS15 n=1 Tax=Mauremys mutica TaxID=74926 RepID=A0A9D3X3P7_9SAUR|nr:hypothetical protein KIL84_007820 [Mauremys mutica]